MAFPIDHRVMLSGILIAEAKLNARTMPVKANLMQKSHLRRATSPGDGRAKALTLMLREVENRESCTLKSFAKLCSENFWLSPYIHDTKSMMFIKVATTV